MLDYNELSKHFNEQQRQDMIELHTLCIQTPPGRIRRARVRKIKPGHIPRPVNSFMAYRTEKQSIIRQFCPTANHRDISKMVAKWWHNVSSNEKSIFIEKAKAAKDAHIEQYPNYTFRPKAKRFDKRALPKKKDGVENQLLEDQNDYGTSARGRVFNKPATTRSHAVSTNEPLYDCSTPIETNMMFNAEPIESNMMYNTGYDGMMYSNNDIYSNNIYNDDVLFKNGENSNFWNNNAYQSSNQIMSNSYSTHIEPQTNYYGMPLAYYPSPQVPGLSPTSVTLLDNSHAINPMATILPTTNTFNSFNGSAGYVNTEGQLFPQIHCEETPQSQAINTPNLAYLYSPSSPAVEGSHFFDNKKISKPDPIDCRFQNSLPTAILSPSANSNIEFMSTWPNDNNNLLDDFGFWGNTIN